ncbi:glycoside hydrolase superfamily [Lasiosphaeris hirsuta]|uniref:alpha-galactosidase n=1 Tax=Lasiosphaeris hirsuta TaxID=260670 RepID=A0AA40EBL1_9PEZI|nr:glycoside hydrolase superfamily [Lasiosphaeris hirsuta]
MAGHPTLLSEHVLGDMTARYLTDPVGRVGLWLYPTAMSDLAQRRSTVANESWVRSHSTARPAMVVEPLVHVKISGDDEPPQLGTGRTLLWSPSIDRFRLLDQRVEAKTVVTTLYDDTGLRIQHRLSAGFQGLTAQSETVFENNSSSPVRLELLTSFSLSGITPYAADDAPCRLRAHRFRSVWSAEGRMVTESIEQLHLERCWAGNMNFSERFGQVGSMPVRGWFPTVLVEDTEANVVWGARLAVPTSWQMELARRFDDLVLAGGLADREFGHWTKTVAPGQSFTTPQAWLTCVAGSVDEACDRLLSVDVPAVEAQPATEQDLPIVYNDYCTSWGEPRQDQLLAIADRIAPLGVGYLVIDAGWYMPMDSGAHWATTLGDWRAHPSRFPSGLAGMAAAIRKRGLVPGIWMEPEHVAKNSDAFAETDHLLTRDGKPLTLGLRRAWNLHDPYVKAYIDDRVIGMLGEAGFGYVKVDYSETLGIGVDHADGLGEGLRRQGEGTHAMFDRIREALPDLVIELVSAGGHRMEASFLQRAAMSSYSDAHETVEIPIIAAAVHRLMLPRQSQIWAVLRQEDSFQRMNYSLAATFLGRMCLSGDILDLNEGQLSAVKDAIKLYKKAVPAIKYGTSRIKGDVGPSWRHPRGWQGVVRTTEDDGVVVIHTFAQTPRELSLQLPGPGWRIVEVLTPLTAKIDGDLLKVVGASVFDSQVIVMRRGAV